MDYKIIKLDISTGKAHYVWFVSGIDLNKAGTQIFIRFPSIPQPFAVFADNVDPSFLREERSSSEILYYAKLSRA